MKKVPWSVLFDFKSQSFWWLSITIPYFKQRKPARDVYLVYTCNSYHNKFPMFQPVPAAWLDGISFWNTLSHPTTDDSRNTWVAGLKGVTYYAQVVKSYRLSTFYGVVTLDEVPCCRCGSNCSKLHFITDFSQYESIRSNVTPGKRKN